MPQAHADRRVGQQRQDAPGDGRRRPGRAADPGARGRRGGGRLGRLDHGDAAVGGRRLVRRRLGRRLLLQLPVRGAEGPERRGAEPRAVLLLGQHRRPDLGDQQPGVLDRRRLGLHPRRLHRAQLQGLQRGPGRQQRPDEDRRPVLEPRQRVARPRRPVDPADQGQRHPVAAQERRRVQGGAADRRRQRRFARPALARHDRRRHPVLLRPQPPARLDQRQAGDAVRVDRAGLRQQRR